MPEWMHVLALVASPIFAAGGAYAAVRVKLEWLTADVKRAHSRIDAHDDLFMEKLREVL